jgi:two-component system nitrate/nitrite response regulator NarL
MACPVVVVVDGHELLASSLAFVLRQEGLDAVIADTTSVESVVEAVREAAPILVLLDLDLDLDLGPRLGCGPALIGRLIEAGGRVVMMTGEAERHRVAACIEAGAAGLLLKTAGFAEFAAAVRRALDGEDLLRAGERDELLGELMRWRQADRDRLAPFSALTPREQAVLAGLVLGESAERIAALSSVSLYTIRSQIKSLLLKLGVSSQLSAVALARRASWPPAPSDRSWQTMPKHRESLAPPQF